MEAAKLLLGGTPGGQKIKYAIRVKSLILSYTDNDLHRRLGGLK